MRFLPKTLQLVVAGMSIAFFVSIPLGAICALRPGRLLDKTLVTLQPDRSGDARSSSSAR